MSTSDRLDEVEEAWLAGEISHYEALGIAEEIEWEEYGDECR